MHEKYYKYPLNFKRFFNNERFDTCSLGESISQNIQMIIVSHCGQHRYNKSLGSDIWDLDFDLIMNIRIWEEKLRTSLLKALYENEKSISQVDLNVSLSEIEKESFFGEYSCVKRRVDIEVNAVLLKTGERYQFTSYLFLSPVSSN